MEYFSRWNIIVGLAIKQLTITNKKPCTRVSTDTIQKWVKEISADNNTTGFLSSQL